MVNANGKTQLEKREEKSKTYTGNPINSITPENA